MQKKKQQPQEYPVIPVTYPDSNYDPELERIKKVVRLEKKYGKHGFWDSANQRYVLIVTGVCLDVDGKPIMDSQGRLRTVKISPKAIGKMNAAIQAATSEELKERCRKCEEERYRPRRYRSDEDDERNKERLPWEVDWTDNSRDEI